jgi:hypothetical protein
MRSPSAEKPEGFSNPEGFHTRNDKGKNEFCFARNDIMRKTNIIVSTKNEKQHQLFSFYNRDRE